MARHITDDDIPPAYACLFNAMKDWQDEHPDATDDEAFEAICCPRVRNSDDKEQAHDHH